MSEILLAGFEPFGGDPRNPSSEACVQLDGEQIAGHREHGVPGQLLAVTLVF